MLLDKAAWIRRDSQLRSKHATHISTLLREWGLKRRPVSLFFFSPSHVSCRVPLDLGLHGLFQHYVGYEWTSVSSLFLFMTTLPLVQTSSEARRNGLFQCCELDSESECCTVINITVYSRMLLCCDIHWLVFTSEDQKYIISLWSWLSSFWKTSLRKERRYFRDEPGVITAFNQPSTSSTRAVFVSTI